jgi:hypothetical protein
LSGLDIRDEKPVIGGDSGSAFSQVRNDKCFTDGDGGVVFTKVGFEERP